MQSHRSKLKIDLKYRAYLFAVSLIKCLDLLEKKDISSEVIIRQLIRSATSIGANIIEAQAGSSKKDFAKFMNIALKSANETKFWIALLRDTGKVSQDESAELLREAVEIANILGASMLTLRGKNKI